MSPLLAEDWFLDSVMDEPAGELVFVASAAYNSIQQTDTKVGRC
jgi:hypothetical protein